MPPVTHSSNAEVAEPRTASRSQRSVLVGTTEASSRRARADGDKRATRDRTASRHRHGDAGAVAGQDLGDKEGVPTRDGIELFGGSMSLVGQVHDRLL
jgi:hypothetical protein